MQESTYFYRSLKNDGYKIKILFDKLQVNPILFGSLFIIFIQIKIHNFTRLALNLKISLI